MILTLPATQSQSTIPAMQLTTTVPVGVGAAEAIEALVKQFPEGKRVRVVVTEEPLPSPTNCSFPQDAPLDKFLQRLDVARQHLPPSPWQTAEEAMTDLREGERD